MIHHVTTAFAQFAGFSTDRPRHGQTTFWLAVLGLLYVTLAGLDSTLIFDDTYLVEHYQRLLLHQSFGNVLRTLFFIVDLGGHEYRLYGVSKILHFFLWYLSGAHAWVYGSLIAFMQFLSGIWIYRILARLSVDSSQALCVAIVWVLSPFSVTACFHHYSYLVLPCQISLICGLILQHMQTAGASILRGRVLLGCMGFLLITTGDSHLPPALLFFALVLVYTPTIRSLYERGVDLAIIMLMMGVTLVIHRWGWHILTAPLQSNGQRYVFSLPTWQNFQSYSLLVLHSLPLGVTDQLSPILALASSWSLLVLILLLLTLVWLMASGRDAFLRTTIRTGSGFRLPVSLFVLFIASLLTVWLLSLSTGQVSVVFPRRYGYVPYTLAAMCIVAALSAPLIRRKIGVLPALAGLGSVSFFWMLLTMVCIPIVRAQDARVWRELNAAIHHRANVNVLFVNSWDHFNRADFLISPVSPGLRGPDFPQVFESPLSNYWWESQYAKSVLGARLAAFRFDDEHASDVRLSSNGLDGQAPKMVPHDSIVVIADIALRPSRFPLIRNRPVVYEKWADFMQSAAAHNGATIETGWLPLVNPSSSDSVQIDVGNTTSSGTGVLPDKSFQDRPGGSDLIANYGFEGAPAAVYNPVFHGPLNYFLSNRHGSFTYRIDFTDESPKTVALDILDIWHSNSGVRSMFVDAEFDDWWWFHVGKVVDPSEYAPGVPLSIQLYPGKAKTVRIRFTPAPGAKDIPFLDGIRVSRASK